MLSKLGLVGLYDKANPSCQTKRRLMSEMSKQQDFELYTILERNTDSDIRGAARAELELRSYRRWRIIADRHMHIARLATVAASASALTAIASVILALTRH